MEFTQGQVFNMAKISEYIKKTKDKKAAQHKAEEAVNLVKNTKAEIDALRSGLNQLTDTEGIEASIYRLKAAELELNRHIKMAKSNNYIKS